MVEVLVHLHNGVDWAFLRSGYVPGDINDAAQIFVIDAALDRLVLTAVSYPFCTACKRIS